jgi:AcrR family transcriptional regulator
VTQKVFFTSEAIVQAAFALTRERGWAAVSARSIAKKLGSSTMPIYSTMKSMEEIERLVRARAESVLSDCQRRPYTDNPVQNLAIGYVAFARDEKNLFRFLYVDRPVAATLENDREGAGQASEAQASAEVAAHLPEGLRMSLQDQRVLKSWIFTHGLASLVGNGVLDLPDEKIRDLLLEAGGAFFLYENQIKRTRPDAAQNEQGGTNG